jgi:hypothetical protein
MAPTIDKQVIIKVGDLLVRSLTPSCYFGFKFFLRIQDYKQLSCLP